MVSYGARVDHIARDGSLGRKLIAFPLHRIVHLVDIGQLVSSFGSSRPGLDVFEDLFSDLEVNGCGSHSL